MKRHLSKVIFVCIIFAAYFLVSGFSTSNDFETKSRTLFNERGAAVIAELDKFPGCAGQFSLKSIDFNKDWLFSKTAEGRSIYTTNSNAILDISWTAEIVDSGRMIIVKPKNSAELETTLRSLMISSCRNS